MEVTECRMNVHLLWVILGAWLVIIGCYILGGWGAVLVSLGVLILLGKMADGVIWVVNKAMNLR